MRLNGRKAATMSQSPRPPIAQAFPTVSASPGCWIQSQRASSVPFHTPGNMTKSHAKRQPAKQAFFPEGGHSAEGNCEGIVRREGPEAGGNSLRLKQRGVRRKHARADHSF